MQPDRTMLNPKPLANSRAEVRVELWLRNLLTTRRPATERVDLFKGTNNTLLLSERLTRWTAMKDW